MTVAAMNTANVAPPPDRTILATVAAYAAAFVVFGFVVDGPDRVLRGLADIVLTRDALLTDYFGVGGIGAACANAGLLTLAACLVYLAAGVKVTGAAVACLFLVLGFGLFGKNLLNIWSIVLGVYLYARFRGEAFAAHINTAFFGAALAPIFSEILFSTTLPFTVRVPLAVGHQPRHRLRPGAGRRAAVQGAHGLQPVQHGIHRRHRGHAGRRPVQVVRVRSGSGLDLDHRQQPAPRRLSRGPVRVDGPGRLPARSRAAVAAAADRRGDRPVPDRFHRAGRLRADAGQHGADRRRSARSTSCWSAANSTARSSARS